MRPWSKDSEDESCSVTLGSDQQVLRQDVKKSPPEFRFIVIRAGLNETFTFASCVICNWLSYLISSHLRRMCAPSHLRSSHLRSSYPISSHLRHICASSYFRSLFQIFTSSLSPSGLHILKPHVVSTSSDLHHVVAPSYHLQDFIMQFLLQFYSLIYIRLQNFISPLSGQQSSSGFLRLFMANPIVVSWSIVHSFVSLFQLHNGLRPN